MTQEPILEAPVVHKTRKGFLPIETNTFDRYFISVIIFVAVNLFFMRFIEPMGVPLWIASVICVAIGYGVVRNG
jgi:predicted small integral membrane protein